MTYEGDRFTNLYKTPKVDLSIAGVPEWVSPKGFMIDLWIDNPKRTSGSGTMTTL